MITKIESGVFVDRSGQGVLREKHGEVMTYELTLDDTYLKIIRYPQTAAIGSVVRIQEGNADQINELASDWLRENGIANSTERVFTLTDADYRDGYEDIALRNWEELQSYEKTIEFQPGTGEGVDLRALLAELPSDSHLVALATLRMRVGAPPRDVAEALSASAWFANGPAFAAELAQAAAMEYLEIS